MSENAKKKKLKIHSLNLKHSCRALMQKKYQIYNCLKNYNYNFNGKDKPKPAPLFPTHKALHFAIAIKHCTEMLKEKKVMFKPSF
jgi:hypothetical protein